MKLTRTDYLTALLGFVTGGPIGAVLSPVSYHTLAKMGQPRWVWGLLGFTFSPFFWALAILPFVPRVDESTATAPLPKSATPTVDEKKLMAEEARLKKAQAQAEADRKTAEAQWAADDKAAEAQRAADDKAAEAQRAADDKAAEERKALESWAKISALVGCKTELRGSLRDPRSYEDDWARPTPRINHKTREVVMVWKFRAKNGFGGYETGVATCATKPTTNPIGGSDYGAPEVTVLTE